MAGVVESLPHKTVILIENPGETGTEVAQFFLPIPVRRDGWATQWKDLLFAFLGFPVPRRHFTLDFRG